MSLDVDGAAVLKAIVESPTVFKGLDRDLSDFAHRMVVKQLKAKGANVSVLRAVRGAIGDDAFRHVVDGLTDGGKSILAKVDKHNPELDTAKPDWMRAHLVTLANGTSEPTAKPSAKTKAVDKKQAAPKPRKQPPKRAISAKAFEAAWDGKNRDE
ncbi:MAG: hypothetical protein HZA68_21020 [Rhodovulum sp.]|nr:hypothetical protein [Rhodovulum sp.]